ncbi:DUF523 domain-containing protein [Clostridium sp.]|uniref:DUF523 domain-containing protein n=1 Tax=Clostridium sp. TaxID=1506 RepID=UPI002A91BE7B|nr:DUF523 domain-containing protein [Clostridium sp.]MDY6011482.1 DUF523 domain-containing protein [Clostridium sp.]
MMIISACLCGCDCKYNGKNNKNESCVELLKRGKAVLVCPEQLGGMTTPRVPSEILKNDGKISVISKEGKDVSKEFKKGAKEALKIAKLVDAKVAILKNGSPSCGSKNIYDGTFSDNKIKGEGITAKLFVENGIEVFSEDEAHKFLL